MFRVQLQLRLRRLLRQDHREVLNEVPEVPEEAELEVMEDGAAGELDGEDMERPNIQTSCLRERSAGT